MKLSRIKTESESAETDIPLSDEVDSKGSLWCCHLMEQLLLEKLPRR